MSARLRLHSRSNQALEVHGEPGMQMAVLAYEGIEYVRLDFDQDGVDALATFLVTELGARVDAQPGGSLTP